MNQPLPKSSDVFDNDRSQQVADLSQKVFKRLPERVAFPGGKSRSAFIVDMGDDLFVFARREDQTDAQLEGIVLKNLAPSKRVPGLKAIVGEWVVQHFVPGARLPIVLNETDDMAEKERLVGSALESLVFIHEAADAASLKHRVPKIGTADKWLWNRTGAAKRISKSLKLPVPDLDREKLVKLMDVKRDEFVKWDARPGNAMVTDGNIVWFDWEDCGRSNALDDLAFVLCDEWCALDEGAETRLKNLYQPFFNRSMSPEHADHYLRLFGITHMVLRLRMSLKLYLRDGDWWDRDYCLQGDKIGVTPIEAARLLARLHRWVDGVDEWQPLKPWLDDVADKLRL